MNSSSKNQQREAEKKQWFIWGAVCLVLLAIGIYLSPDQWIVGVLLTLFYFVVFYLRMYAWDFLLRAFEFSMYALPFLLVTGWLYYYYKRDMLNTGTALQIIASAPLAFLLVRGFYVDKYDKMNKRIDRIDKRMSIGNHKNQEDESA